MDNASIILLALDERLDHAVRLILNGRAALQLGFNSPPPEIAQSKDVDAIVPVAEVETLLAAGWDPAAPAFQAIGYRQIVRYLRVGDVVSGTTVLESVSPQKQTRIGPGYFVTWVTTYTDADGEVVGLQRFRILKFRPEGTAS